ncbi:carbohydrate ABC transporter permease [Atribacter laminatus]|uniref:Inner membrane ABC transporter permease protein YcjO n=1 Tax=Atribacter laminatus TaxID=2847778 RepID=A0A7T1AKM4_ATRLM|nr:sugar ABC transporter permease [Atribacter laminatus]QPM67646.1 Inner membrane ABC transporter permease protein YcjO [Atribacter laminatus]
MSRENSLTNKIVGFRNKRSTLSIKSSSAVLIIPATIIMGIVVIYPIITTVLMSFTDAPLVSLSKPSFVGMFNYSNWLMNLDFWRSFWITLLYTFGVTIGSYIIGLLTALLLNLNFPGRAILRGLILIPWAVPEVAAVMVWNWMFDYQFGIVNSLLSSPIGWVLDAAAAPWTVTVVTIWKQFPLATVIILAGLQAIPIERYEAAEVDGANSFQKFFNITIPGLKSVNIVLIMMLILYTFKRVTIVYLLTGGGPARATEILPVTTYLEAFKYFRLGSASAVGILSLILTLVITFIYSKMVTRGEA